jgi:hypothetical protein
MTNVYYKDVECFFTNEGRTTFVKQTNGIKFSKIGAVLISDKNKSLLNALTDNKETVLNNLTFKQLEKITQLIFTNIGYSYDSGTYTPIDYKAYNKTIISHINLLDVGVTYEGKEETNSFSYNISLKTNSLNIDNNSSEDLNFDGIALIGLPYKQELLDTTSNILEEQTNTVLAIVYFKNDNEKLQILYNQPATVEFNTIINIKINEQIDLSPFDVNYVDSLNRPIEDTNVNLRNVLGLTKTNDAQTNRDAPYENPNAGTINNLLLSNIEMPNSYDSFAKLNIMTKANYNISAATPQIMLAQTTTGANKTWNGDRLTINYNSLHDGSYFCVSEITGTYRNRINFDLFGENNIYHTAIKGYGNSFIYSKANKLANKCYNNSFIHSDYNKFYNDDLNNINFINSNFNIVRSEKIDDFGSSATNIGLYNSNNNTIHSKCSQYTIVENNKKTIFHKKGILDSCTLLNSNGNYLKGKTYCPDDKNRFEKSNSTFINSFSGLYNLTENGDSVTMIGNTFGWVNAPTGNIIGIGEGLIQDGGSGDRIIMGNYNRNITDPNEVLVIGDGRMNKTWLKGQVSAIKDWNTNLTAFEKLMKTISGVGSPTKNSDFYRHNIFTVNKNGYITISDYDTNNSARYGFSGITAYNGNGDKTYELPFKKMYDVLNAEQANNMGIEELNSKMVEMQALIDSVTPTQFLNVNNKYTSHESSSFTAYLNIPNDVPNRIWTASNVTADCQNYTPIVGQYSNNTVFTVSYIPISNTNAKDLTVVYWLRTPGNIESSSTSSTTTIKPYETKQFIKYSQVLTTDTMDGITIVE